MPVMSQYCNEQFDAMSLWKVTTLSTDIVLFYLNYEYIATHDLCCS